MADLIDRQALIKLFCERCNEEMSEEPCEPSDCWARKIIKTLPPVDAVEVVRCKDCRHWKRYGDEDNPAGDCSGIEPACCMNEDDFCSYGERRADNAAD